jgi:trehalose 6-phosphate synthase
VLVLSETAGAFDQMADGVLPVAPADVAGTAEALSIALQMPAAERHERNAVLRRGVEREDIGWWLRRQMEDMARLEGRRDAAMGRAAVSRRQRPAS